MDDRYCPEDLIQVTIHKVYVDRITEQVMLGPAGRRLGYTLAPMPAQEQLTQPPKSLVNRIPHGSTLRQVPVTGLPR